MKPPLKILLLEDNHIDAALVESTLEAEGIECQTNRVHTQADFVAALEAGGIDLILSDYSLPAFNGLKALEIAHERWPFIPLIFVSGTLGEELAVNSLQKGAVDYIIKGHLKRLAPAVRRALRQVEERAERQELELQLIEAQKMEVIGQLAGGVAHDFNNIISIVMGYADLLNTGLPENSPLQDYVREIGLAAERAAGLTRQLLIFSRKQAVQQEVLDLNQVIRGLDEMLHRLVDENIALRILPGNDLGHVNADSGHVGQILMNLVVNARDAMPNGGQLTIATSNVMLDESYVQAEGRAVSGDYVLLSVADTGTGMTPEVKARIFEAFFTTKPAGKGTGLGLATCQTIVQQFGGHITVQSDVGVGTRFGIYFPCTSQELPLPVQTNEEGPMVGGSETVLVVEDDAGVRQLAQGILETLGYHVLAADNGQEALSVAQAHAAEAGGPVDLVVTDVIMPEMGGKVMAEWLLTACPALKILYTSGYTDDTIMPHGVLEKGVEFMSKPYTPAILARKVRDMLDKPPQAGR